MAKFCTYCGAEVNENAVICTKCGCPIPKLDNYNDDFGQKIEVIDVISKRIRTNGIIWIAVGLLQIFLGIFINWILIIVGVLNLISSSQDLKYSKTFPKNPVGIVSKVEPLILPIIVLIYNFFIGGVIGVVGSIYYLVAVRGYVLENKQIFCEIEKKHNLE